MIESRLYKLNDVPVEFQKICSEIEVARAKRDFFEFVKLTWPFISEDDFWMLTRIKNAEYIQYHQRLCESLVTIVKSSSKNVCLNTTSINASVIASIALPTWLWLKDPANRVSCFSFGDGLAAEYAESCLEFIKTYWFQNTFRVSWKLFENEHMLSNDQNGVRGYSFPAGPSFPERVNYCIIDFADPRNSQFLKDGNNYWLNECLRKPFRTPALSTVNAKIIITNLKGVPRDITHPLLSQIHSRNEWTYLDLGDCPSPN